MSTTRLNGARAFVTGGAGFIGSHVVDRLIAAGADVVVYDNLCRGRADNLASARRSDRLTFIQGDVRDAGAVRRAMEGASIVLHLAALRLRQCIEEPRAAIDVMAHGAFNVFDAAAAAGVRRVVLASSSSMYGASDRPARENDPLRGATLYASAKVFSEGLLAAMAERHGFSYVSLRPFNVYGPRMDVFGAYTEVLIRWMDRIQNGLPPVVFGDGLASMDLVFVDDVARAFVDAAAADVSGEIFNIATGVETTLRALVRELLLAMDATVPVQFAPDDSGVPAVRRVGDTTRAKRVLGFEAQVPLHEGLRQLVRWKRDAVLV